MYFKNMREILKELKFIKTHSCNCGGFIKETWQSYKYPGIAVEIKPEADFFEIYNSRKKLKIRGDKSEFELKLMDVVKRVQKQANP